MANDDASFFLFLFNFYILAARVVLMYSLSASRKWVNTSCEIILLHIIFVQHFFSYSHPSSFCKIYMEWPYYEFRSAEFDDTSHHQHFQVPVTVHF